MDDSVTYRITAAMPKSLQVRLVIERVLDAIQRGRLPTSYRMETYPGRGTESIYLAIRWNSAESRRRNYLYLGVVEISLAALGCISEKLCQDAQDDLYRLNQQFEAAKVDLDPLLLEAPIKKIMDGWERVKGEYQGKAKVRKLGKKERQRRKFKQILVAAGVIQHTWEDLDRTFASMTDAEFEMMAEYKRHARQRQKRADPFLVDLDELSDASRNREQDVPVEKM